MTLLMYLTIIDTVCATVQQYLRVRGWTDLNPPACHRKYFKVCFEIPNIGTYIENSILLCNVFHVSAKLVKLH